LFFLEHSYIAIGIVKGKMLSIAIHMPAASVATLNIPENGDIVHADKNGDDNHITNGFSGTSLTTEKDIPLASLSTARCGFGITSTNDAIFVVGMFCKTRTIRSSEV